MIFNYDIETEEELMELDADSIHKSNSKSEDKEEIDSELQDFIIPIKGKKENGLKSRKVRIIDFQEDLGREVEKLKHSFQMINLTLESFPLNLSEEYVPINIKNQINNE